MSWFDDAEQEFKTMRVRSESIYKESEKIFNLLWEAIVREIPHARVSIVTNGSTFDRILRHQVTPSQDGSRGIAREMIIRLTSDRRHILATAPSLGEFGPSSVDFDLDILSDGVVRLLNERRPVEIQAAAIMVLRNFLFPDLPLRGP
jgi:hypothetical protein